MTVTRCPFDHQLISAFESGRGGLYNSFNSGFNPTTSYGFTPSSGETNNYLPASTYTDSYAGDGNRRGDVDISYYDEGNGKIESGGEATGSFDGAMEGYGGGGGAFGGEEGGYDIQTGGYRPPMGENEGSYVGSTGGGDSYMVPVRRQQDMYNSPLLGSINPYLGAGGGGFNSLMGRKGESSPVTD